MAVRQKTVFFIMAVMHVTMGYSGSGSVDPSWYGSVDLELSNNQQEASDTPCSNINGICQQDNKKCTGSYVTGKCSGGAKRRCCTRTAVESDTGFCSNVIIVSRDSWGARRPKGRTNINVPVKDLFIHHTAGNQCNTFSDCVKTMKVIQNLHMDTRGWSDIGYNFLIGGDGKVYEGRSWATVGAHARGYNSVSYGVALMGNFQTIAPTTSPLTASKNLIQCGLNMNKISSTYALFGHRDVGTTLCPGQKLYDIIKTWPRFKANPAK